jgi:hypothetical protein
MASVAFSSRNQLRVNCTFAGITATKNVAAKAPPVRRVLGYASVPAMTPAVIPEACVNVRAVPGCAAGMIRSKNAVVLLPGRERFHPRTGLKTFTTGLGQRVRTRAIWTCLSVELRTPPRGDAAMGAVRVAAWTFRR